MLRRGRDFALLLRRLVGLRFFVAALFRRLVVGFAARRVPPVGAPTFTFTFVWLGVVREELVRVAERLVREETARLRDVLEERPAVVAGLRRRLLEDFFRLLFVLRLGLRRLFGRFRLEVLRFVLRRAFLRRFLGLLFREGVFFFAATFLTSLVGLARRAATRSPSTGFCRNSSMSRWTRRPASVCMLRTSQHRTDYGLTNPLSSTTHPFGNLSCHASGFFVTYKYTFGSKGCS